MDTLIRLKRSQVESAARVLARAFENDSLYVVYFPDATKRIQQIYHLMKFSIRYCMRYGEVYTTSSNLEGIALLQLEEPILEQDQEDEPTSIFLNWLNFRLWVSLGDTLEKVTSDYGYMVSIHRELIPSCHWYFFIIGVDPKFQAQGFGSSLISSMLVRVDKGRLSCYLDTNTERNLALYKHFGFKVVKRSEIPGSDVINWSMVREPHD